MKYDCQKRSTSIQQCPQGADGQNAWDAKRNQKHNIQIWANRWKKDDVNQFIIMIMTYWTNVGSRGRAIITANLKRTLLSSLDLLTK